MLSDKPGAIHETTNWHLRRRNGNPAPVLGCADGRCTLLEQTPELTALTIAGRDIMLAFPVVPSACVMMGALYAFQLQQRGYDEARLVGGALLMDGQRVFGRPSARHSFARNNASWDGHAWVSLGELIADASLVRTGLSQKAPAKLRAFVAARFGLKEGLYIATVETALDDGLGYEQQHVFSDAELVACCRGAIHYLKGLLEEQALSHK